MAKKKAAPKRTAKKAAPKKGAKSRKGSSSKAVKASVAKSKSKAKAAGKATSSSGGGGRSTPKDASSAAGIEKIMSESMGQDTRQKHISAAKEAALKIGELRGKKQTAAVKAEISKLTRKRQSHDRVIKKLSVAMRGQGGKKRSKKATPKKAAKKAAPKAAPKKKVAKKATKKRTGKKK